MDQNNHEWVVRVIKHSKKGDLKKKRFTLFPRSRRSVESYCQENDCVLCCWDEDQNSRLLFQAYFVAAGSVVLVLLASLAL